MPWIFDPKKNHYKYIKEVHFMDKLTIPVSPKVAEVLAKSRNLVQMISDFMTKLLDACADGKISFDEVLSLIGAVVNIGRQLARK
jgi:hypothetical protein